MTMIAYAFLQHRRLTHAGREKKNPRRSTSTNSAGRATRSHRRPCAKAAARAMSTLPHPLATATMKLPK
jgi:hypothetical protein